MSARTVRRTAGIVGGVAAGAAAAYGVMAGVAWLRFGHARRPRRPGEEDALLDRFMPLYDIVERHQIHVQAPASVTFDCARTLEAGDLPLVRAIFKGRELLMRSSPPPVEPPRRMAEAALSIGWRVLAEMPDREIVFGAVTRPWEANPVFRGIAAPDFAAFAEPDFVKIVFTLRADPAGEGSSIFRTETRAVATDNAAREKFRNYWALVSPGVALIRLGLLGPIKGAAERRTAELDEPEVAMV